MRIRKLSYDFLNSVRTGYNFPAWVEAFGHWARVDLDNPKNYRCWLGAKFHSGEPVEHKRYIPIRDDEALALDEALNGVCGQNKYYKSLIEEFVIKESSCLDVLRSKWIGHQYKRLNRQFNLKTLIEDKENLYEDIRLAVMDKLEMRDE